MFVLGIAMIVIALIAGLLVGVKTWVIVVAGLGGGLISLVGSEPFVVEAIPLLAIGLLLSAAGFFFIYKQFNKKHTEKISNKQATKTKQLISFYEECKENDITDLKSEKEIQKATLIAKKYNIPFTDIKELYREADAALIAEQKKEKEAHLAEMKEEEKVQYGILTKYLNYTGRDKKIAILSDERIYELNVAHALDKGTQAQINSLMQREHDWAIHGGIASGIAGGAAGAATAMNIQAKNAEIRAQNDAIRKEYEPLRRYRHEQEVEHEKIAKEIEKDIEAAKVKLVQEDTNGDLFSRLIFTNVKLKKSDTGTCTVTASVSMDIHNPIKIFDDVDAVIDGSINAEIYDGDELIGTAPIVLPKDGIQGVVKVTGMCLFCGVFGKKYTVKFTNRKLWAIEK